MNLDKKIQVAIDAIISVAEHDDEPITSLLGSLENIATALAFYSDLPGRSQRLIARYNAKLADLQAALEAEPDAEKKIGLMARINYVNEKINAEAVT